MDWSRRQVMCGGLLTVLQCAICGTSAHAEEYEGCWVGGSAVSDKSSSGDFSNLKMNSGIDNFDLALVRTLDMLSDMFGVLPGFAFYEEPGAPDSRATNRDLTGKRPDGTVMIGMKLVRQLLALPEYPDAAIVAVCAHEFAHILSYSNGMIAQLSVPGNRSPIRAEQFADYMAGYFAGRRKLSQPTFPAVVFATTVQMYGTGTHGTPEQRSNAVESGFLTAWIRRLEPQAATRRAVEYAQLVS